MCKVNYNIAPAEWRKSQQVTKFSKTLCASRLESKFSKLREKEKSNRTHSGTHILITRYTINRQQTDQDDFSHLHVPQNQNHIFALRFWLLWTLTGVHRWKHYIRIFRPKISNIDLHAMLDKAVWRQTMLLSMANNFSVYARWDNKRCVLSCSFALSPALARFLSHTFSHKIQWIIVFVYMKAAHIFNIQ